MNRWEFKEAIKLRFKISKAILAFNTKQALAYAYNNWGGMASTVTYMITYLAFLSIIYARVKSIAGYSYADMLMFTLVGQISFYTNWFWSLNGIQQMVRDVNSGRLDLILSKPLPALWFVTFQKANLPSILFQSVPAMIPLLVLIAKHASYLPSLRALFLATVCFILGVILIHCFTFILGLTVFWTGQNRAMINLGYQLSYFGDTIPFEAYPKSIVWLGLTIVPFLAHIALTSSYLLGKTESLNYLLIVLVAVIIFLAAKIRLWRVALRRYASASS